MPSGGRRRVVAPAFAHLVDGLGHLFEADHPAMLGDGSSRPSATASSVRNQSCGCGPPPNWIVMPLWVRRGS